MKNRVNNFLLNAYKKKELNLIDINFSKLFYFKKDNNSYIYILFACILSLSNRLGHIFVYLNDFFNKNIFFSKYILEFLYFFFNKHIKIKNCINLMLDCYIISLWFNKKNTPFILYNDCIYLYKNWYYENYVITYLSKNFYVKFKKDIYLKYLNIYIKNLNLNLNFKKIILSSIFNKITIITGSPGTGKSTLIIKIIILLYKIFKFKDKNSIILLSPTGKLSSWLTDCLNNIYNLLNISNDLKEILPSKCLTIHKFLGFNYLYNYLKFNKNNKILSNYIIIDECSMISLNIFYNILSSLNSYTKLILIGDYNQLDSVESISIFNNICNIIYDNFFFKDYLNCFLYYKNIFILKKNYRYINDNKNIGIFLNLIKNKDYNILYKYFLNNSFSNIIFYDSNKFGYDFFLDLCIKFYKNYINFILYNFDINKIFNIFKKNQIICILKETKNGVYFVNNLINNYIYNLFKNKFLFNFNDKIHFLGEPVLITKNNNDLKLYNGDLGFFVSDKKNNLRLYFNKKINYFHPFILYNNLINAWSITVHKSQGSEYDNVLLILPNKFINILNNNIIYTALSRSKKKIIIYGDINILINSIKVIYNKNTNFRKRLNIYC